MNSDQTPIDGVASSTTANVPPRAPFGGDEAFRAIFEAAPYGLILVDDDGRIVLTNPRLDTKFGYGRGELVGHPLENLLPERHRTIHPAERAGFALNPRARSMGEGRDLTGLHKDGFEFPVEVGLFSVATDQGQLSAACVVDITKRKRDEHRLHEANALLEEFTYVASHDLRSPVRGIANLIDFIREDHGESLPDEVQRNLARIAQRVDQLESLIEDLLSYARSGRRTLKHDHIDVAALINSVLDLEAPGPEVTVIPNVPELSFEGTLTPLATVLRNLVSNAIRHHDRNQKTIWISAWFDDQHCVFEIRDDGPGIPKAAQSRIFRLFQTLSSSSRHGSGLGLAVVERLVEGHGGTISVRSIDGERGSCFTVHWPRFARSELGD